MVILTERYNESLLALKGFDELKMGRFLKCSKFFNKFAIWK